MSSSYSTRPVAVATFKTKNNDDDDNNNNNHRGINYTLVFGVIVVVVVLIAVFYWIFKRGSIEELIPPDDVLFFTGDNSVHNTEQMLFGLVAAHPKTSMIASKYQNLDLGVRVTVQRERSIVTPPTAQIETLDNHDLIQGFSGSYSDDVNLVKQTTAIMTNPNKIKISDKNNTAVASCNQYTRLADGKTFYLINVRIGISSSVPYKKYYKCLRQLLEYIMKELPGEYIIVGDFGVHGFEKVFEHVLGSKAYHICPMYNQLVSYRQKVLVSQVGIVVSKALYSRVEYFVDFMPTAGDAQLLLGAYMYKHGVASSTVNVTSAAMRRFCNYIDRRYRETEGYQSFIGSVGEYDPNDEVTDEWVFTMSNPSTFYKYDTSKSIITRIVALEKSS
ncbi:hypothetical protein HT594_00139 [Phenacoccus solenopsis nudivirus]|nr:hypothetical protein HT594_00139 [Phenacoccus solenopsis nudivirus]